MGSDMSGIGSDLDHVLRRASDSESFERWFALGRSAGWCVRPVRLAGRTDQVDPSTGEILSTYCTASEPDGHLLKACGTRRATACEPCSAVYRADAWHLIAAGLRGGKGIQPEVTDHPTLFVTLTAPSFGPVHSLRTRNGSAQSCHPSSRARCIHGRPRRCTEVHGPGDERLGEPLCEECFDYIGAILWNAHVSELWRRTTISMRRRLAKMLGVPDSRFAEHARLSYAKVIEYQDRGLVHLHVVVRLDGPAGPQDSTPRTLTVERFQAAAVGARQGTRLPLPLTMSAPRDARWGGQFDVREVTLDEGAPGAIAAYIAKYSTKSTDGLGQLDHRLHEKDLDSLDLRPHLKRLVTTAWELGGRPELEHLKLRRWAHTLGFRGHWLTKSRRYSTTLGALRAARGEWTQRHRENPGTSDTVAVKDWRYLGRGWDNPGDAWLARTAAAAAAESRTLARDARLAERDA